MARQRAQASTIIARAVQRAAALDPIALPLFGLVEMNLLGLEHFNPNVQTFQDLLNLLLRETDFSADALT